jgi:putative ATP-dependent endonuclease of the OLD family
MSEGFFADVVVLVEGDDDRAAIMGMSEVMDVNLESTGISVLPCSGKGSLDRPAVIFSRLGIPVYLLWDSDKGDKECNPADNHRLLRVVGQEVCDYPSLIEDTFACFETNLETTLRNELGPADFDRHLKKCQAEMGIKKRKHAMKNPVVIANIIRSAQSEGVVSETLVDIIVRIQMLKH